MYNREKIEKLISFVFAHDGIGDKTKLTKMVQSEFALIRDRCVFYCGDYAIRFCKAKKASFGNTVLSLSSLRKYDKIPFIVCLVTPERNYLLLANTSFLRKVSHSSLKLRVDNIRGSFNGSDIIRNYDGIINEPANFEFLFSTHENFTFEENLVRLVESTNNIHPSGKKFSPTKQQISCILRSVERAQSFLESTDYDTLNNDLQTRVSAVENEIAIAAFIENVNLRGRIIEYLITSTDSVHSELISALHNKTPLPQIYTLDKLGDYERSFDNYETSTDIKTKVLFLTSNPKGYNIDKLLSFLAEEKSVYLIFVVTIDDNKHISTRLCSMFNRQLLKGTRINSLWAGLNSRGVTQYYGEALKETVFNFDKSIDVDAAKQFIGKCISL